MSILLAALAVLIGGLLKGAIGAGVPIVAAPALTILFDVQTAVAVMVVPNLISNLWQGWQFRAQALGGRFLWMFAGGGVLGVAAGTAMLALLPQQALALMVALAVLAFIALRLSRPDWTLSRRLGERFSGPAGALGGMLQGATGISAPASITFLNAMRLPRETFIGTISIFFIAMTAMQFGALWGAGLLSLEKLGYGAAAMALVAAAMPLGSWLGKRLSPRVFDRMLLVLLAAIAARILFDVLF